MILPDQSATLIRVPSGISPRGQQPRKSDARLPNSGVELRGGTPGSCSTSAAIPPAVTHSRRPSALGKNRTTCRQMVLFLPTMKSRDLDTAVQAFRHKGGTLRTRDLIAQGVHTDALYALRESGRIIELGRGLYRLAEAGEAEHPYLAVVAARAPNAAVCLISALAYHNITTQVPSSVHLAVPR